MFWKPHVVLSIISQSKNIFGDEFFPLFIAVCKEFNEINVKFIAFFLNCLFYHSFVMLKEENNDANKFLKRYFNWGNPDHTMGGYDANSDTHYFYGIRLSSIVSSSTQSSIVKLILEKEYLKVFSFTGPTYNGSIVNDCIFKYGNLHYLSLLSHYIRKGDVNRDDSDLDYHLWRLFDEAENISRSNNLDQFLFYFLKLCKNGDVTLTQSKIEEALNMCRNSKCKEILNEYIEKEYK